MELNQKPWFKFKEPLDKAQSNNDDFPYSDNTILSIKLDDLLLALLNANKFKLFSQIREIITNNTVFNKELKDIKNNSKKMVLKK